MQMGPPPEIMNPAHLFVRSRPIPRDSPLPNVTLPDQDGSPIGLAQADASEWILVYFYPKADTPGCTAQGCSLRDDWRTLAQRGVLVYGVSRDRPEALRRFRNKYRLPFVLLSDADGEAARAFGVGAILGFSRRESFLFRNGRLVWSTPSARTRGHAAEVLAVIETLS